MRLSRSGASSLLVSRLVVFFSLLIALAGFIQREAELLDGADDHLVRIVLGQGDGARGRRCWCFPRRSLPGSLLNLLARLPVEILAVHDEKAFVDIIIVLQQGGGLEGGERLAAAGGVPDVAIAAVCRGCRSSMMLHRIDLIWAHHEELLLAGDAAPCSG